VKKPMSEKTNKMKIEKKLVAAIALIVTIGIATIIPLTFFMSTAKAQADEPWFNIDLTYAYFNADTYFNSDVADDIYQVDGVIVFDALLYADAFNQHDARVEYFEFTLYTDELQLSKTHEFIGMDKPGLEKSTIMGTFRTEAWYNIPWLEEKLGVTYGIMLDASAPTASPLSSGGRYHIFNGTAGVPDMLQDTGCGGRRVTPRDETSDTILATLEKTQTIYLDIKRVAYITFDDNGTVTTSECDQLLQHIELTKNSNGEFIFGDLPTYVEDAVSNLGKNWPDNAIHGASSVHF
jgi:hypothetical protein